MTGAGPTRAGAEDIDSAAVAKLLGHMSTRMVDLVYGHLPDETLAAAVAVLSATGGSVLVAASVG